MNKGQAYRYPYPDNLIARIFTLLKDTAPQFFAELKPGYDKRLNEALKILPVQEFEAIEKHYIKGIPYTAIPGDAHSLCTQGIRKLQRPYIKNLILGNLANNQAATIGCLNLSNRAYNCLGRMGCVYIEDVLRALPRWNDNGEMVCSDKILRIRHTGEETYAEIINELHRNNLLKEAEYRLMVNPEETNNA